MDETKVCEWLFADLNELIDFSEYLNIPEDGEYERREFTEAKYKFR